jgi:hypothetical protein
MTSGTVKNVKTVEQNENNITFHLPTEQKTKIDELSETEKKKFQQIFANSLSLK